MRAVVFHGVGDIRLDEVAEPRIQEPTDAVVRITRSAICGTDLHFVRGTMSGMEPGTILGHEGVGVVEEVGPEVRNFSEGDRVVIPSTIACGSCGPCRHGMFSQCDRANPNGPQAGTAFYGGPASTGPFDGLQAERARIPFANVGMVKLPPEVTDDQAILLSDIFPTGWFGADLAGIRPGSTVAIFGCGPVGQFAIASAILMSAGRVLAVDAVESRLAMAKAQGAEVISFEEDEPVEVIRSLTGGVGVDAVIDAVGVDANHPAAGDGAQTAQQEEESRQNAAQANPQGDNWRPGNAPTQVLSWAVEAVAKAGTVSIIGVYPPTVRSFPIGQAMNRNLTVRMGNCNHRKYLPRLIELVRSGAVDPAQVLTQQQPFAGVIEAYRAFDTRQPHWVKVELQLAQ